MVTVGHLEKVSLCHIIYCNTSVVYDLRSLNPILALVLLFDAFISYVRGIILIIVNLWHLSQQNYLVLRYNWYEGANFFLFINIAYYVYMNIEFVSIPTHLTIKFIWKPYLNTFYFPFLKTRGALKMPSLKKKNIDLERLR